MPLIQNPAIGRKLQRNLRLTQLPNGILAEETVPVILVEDYSAPSNEIERGCMGAANQAPVAAEQSIVALVLAGVPALYTLTVTKVTLSSDVNVTASIIAPTEATVGLTQVSNTHFTDFSIPGRPASFLGKDTAVGGVSGGMVMWQERVLADTPVVVPVRIVVGGEFASLLVEANGNQTRLAVSFEWTESVPLG